MAPEEVFDVGSDCSWPFMLAERACIVDRATPALGKATVQALAEPGAGVVAVDLEAIGLAMVASSGDTIVPQGDRVGEDVARGRLGRLRVHSGSLSGLVANVGVAVTARESRVRSSLSTTESIFAPAFCHAMSQGQSPFSSQTGQIRRPAV